MNPLVATKNKSKIRHDNSSANDKALRSKSNLDLTRYMVLWSARPQKERLLSRIFCQTTVVIHHFVLSHGIQIFIKLLNLLRLISYQAMAQHFFQSSQQFHSIDSGGLLHGCHARKPATTLDEKHEGCFMCSMFAVDAIFVSKKLGQAT